jgi:hypothetical protein
MAPVTTVTRRVEFYEADGVTPWGDSEEASSSLKDGSVSVDSTRDERRSLDMTLDNSSGAFVRDPNNGFWYDKVVKVYRGIQYTSFEEYEQLILGFHPDLYWRMDGALVTRDRSNNGMHARRVGWPVLTRPLVDTPDSMGSVRFGEDATFMRTADILTTHPAYAGATWTLEAWVRPIGLSPAFGGQIFGRDGIDCRIQIATDLKIQAIVRNAAGTLFVASPSWSATPGNIYHVAATLDGSFLRLYVNGNLEASVTFSGVSIQSTTGFSTGNAGDGSTKQLRGDVDECVYFARVLRQDEIAQHYQSGRGRREVKHSWEAQIGEFLIDKIDEARFPKETKITGRDYTKKCLLAQLPVAMSFDTKTPLEDFVRAMAANAGIKKMTLPKTGVTIGTATDFDQGTERWNVMSKACETAAYELFFTPDGYLTMRKQLDPSTSPVTLTFETGPKGNLVDWSKSSTDTEIRNRIICVSDGSDQVLPFYGEAVNTEITSPTNTTRLGERTFIYTSPFFTSNDQCKATAQQMLKIKALESFNVDFSSLVFPWTEAGEIVEFLDPDAAAYDPTRFLLSSFTIPLKLGPMTATAKRIIIVGELANPLDVALAAVED